MGLAPYGRTDPDLMALLRRLYTVEGHKLCLRRGRHVQAVAAEILARRPADALRAAAGPTSPAAARTSSPR